MGIEDSQKKVDNEVQNLLEKIRNNQKRIHQIRNVGVGAPEQEEIEAQTASSGGQIVEEAKNGSVVLNQQDLEIIARVESRLRKLEMENKRAVKV